MKHLFISYELALLAKEKGFDDPCLGFYHPNIVSDGNMLTTAFDYNFDVTECTTNTILKQRVLQPQIACPIYQQIIDWFREKHNIHISIHSNGTNEKFTSYYFTIMKLRKDCLRFSNVDYYNGLNKAVEEAFKLI